jgi:hypothetical protein
MRMPSPRVPTFHELAVLAASLTLADAIREFGVDSEHARKARELLEHASLSYRDSRRG